MSVELNDRTQAAHGAVDALRTQALTELAAAAEREGQLAADLADLQLVLTAESSENDRLEQELADTVAALQSTTAALTLAQVDLAAARRRIRELEALQRTMLVGTSLYREQGESFVDAFVRRARSWGAEPELARFFYTGLPTGVWPTFGEKAETIISFKVPTVTVSGARKADIAGLLAGKYDAQLSTYFSTAPRDGRRKRVAFWHEPENDSPSLFTPAEWRAAVGYVADFLRKLDPAQGFEVGVILMQWTLEPKSGRLFADWVPSAELDFFGFDCYIKSGTEAQTRERYGRVAAAVAAAKPGTPIFLGETAPGADTTQAQRAAWLPMAFDVARELGFAGVCYYDAVHVNDGVTNDFRLLSAEAQAAIGQEIRK